MTWGFIWLMLVLKIPIAMLLYIVWWAIHQDTEPEAGNDDGGTKTYPHGSGRRLPRRPRPRGPHGDPATPSPSRTRRTPTPARAREHGRG
jgi:hypothetical protein